MQYYDKLLLFYVLFGTNKLISHFKLDVTFIYTFILQATYQLYFHCQTWCVFICELQFYPSC